jgi:type II secretory pathway pseudopilin PulG
MTSRNTRDAFSLLDLTVSLSLLLAVLVVATQVAVWSLGERTRSEVRQEAIEAVANVLELARTRSWDGLDAGWASEQKLPASLTGRLEKAKLVVRVEIEEARPGCKRVSAELNWTLVDGKPAAPVRLTALFAPRTAEIKGAQP